MKFTRLFSIVAVISFCPQAYAESKINIGGIHLGSSAAEAHAGATVMNKKFKFVDLKRQEDGKTIGFNGSEDGAFPADSIKVIFTDTNTTWFIYRNQRYEEGSRPTRDAVFSALIEKYGEPTFSNTKDILNGNASWHFDRAGKIYHGPLGKAPCSGTDSRGGGTPPSSFTERCGVFVQASWNFMNKEKMVQQLEVTAHESSIIYDAIRKKQDASNAIQRKPLEQEQSKNIKPKL